jgi:hypothetical protein
MSCKTTQTVAASSIAPADPLQRGKRPSGRPANLPLGPAVMGPVPTLRNRASPSAWSFGRRFLQSAARSQRRRRGSQDQPLLLDPLHQLNPKR